MGDDTGARIGKINDSIGKARKTSVGSMESEVRAGCHIMDNLQHGTPLIGAGLWAVVDIATVRAVVEHLHT